MNGLVNRVDRFLTDKSIRFQILKYNWFTKKKSLLNFKKNLKNITPASHFLTFNSSDIRKVELIDSDQELDEVILTCYFTKKPDPIKGFVRLNPDINYIAPWYESIVKLKLKGVVIHDGLDKDFIDKYQNEFVQFREYTAGNYSIFEERWFAYYLFVSQTNIKNIFITDANDVYITANPFPFVSDREAIYIGRDNANKVKDSGWLLKELKEFEKDAKIKAPTVFNYQCLYNAGIVGGHRELILFFIARVLDCFLKTESNSHKDMTVLNLVVHWFFSPNINTNIYSKKLVDPKEDSLSSSKHIVSGFPLNSEFKKNELTSKAYFIHK